MTASRKGKDAAILDTGTIVAVATAEGKGGLAVVRLSGPDAVAIARRILPDGALADPLESHRARLATVSWPEGAVPVAGLRTGVAIDQVMVLPMLAPGSFTGEDTVEFSCHGGTLPARQLVAACRAAGARTAGPGEFSRRAFLNGRLSLDQAEAVAELIDAEHGLGARTALAQLRGSLDRELGLVSDPLRGLLAHLEGAMEFGDDETAGPTDEELRATLGEARRRIDGLLDLVPAGRRLREGIQVVLVGPPNAGKSSLFNALLARPRAIVDGAPGTTRDVVTDTLELDGLLFVLHDTAGLHAAAVGVEAEGVARARAALRRADIVLAVRSNDATDAASAGDLPPVDPVETPADSVTIVVAAKCDLGGGAADADLATSTVTGEGLDALKRRLVESALAHGLEEAAARGLVLNQRHQDRLLACRRSLDELLAATDAGQEVLASLLALTLQELDAITGRVFTEQLLDEVFGRFCVGK